MIRLALLGALALIPASAREGSAGIEAARAPSTAACAQEPAACARTCAAGAQDAPQAPTCKKCSSTGRIACSEHARPLCEAEDKVLFCSVIADCPVCAGTGWVACKDCENVPAREALEKKRADVATRKTMLAALDEKMGRPLCKAETKHAILVWEIERQKVEKKFLDQHEALHLYAERLEDLYADYCARLQVTDKDFREKFRVFVWGYPKDHQQGATAFCGQNARGGVKLMGQRPSYSVCGNKQNFQSDERLHRDIVHCVVHLLMSAQKQPQWIGNIKGGWADEGLAHWFEDRYWGVCDTYCYQEANTMVGFKGGRWKVAVREMVDKGEAPPAAGVFERNIDTLTLPENAAAFSYVDYLVSRDGAKFTEMVELLKKKVPTREALKQVWGYNVLEFEELWKAWVRATYPTK